MGGLSIKKSHENGIHDILGTIISGSTGIMSGRGELRGGGVKAG